MRYVGGGVGHQDVSEPEICDVETGEIKVEADPQDVGSDGEGTSNSKKDLSDEEESSIGDDSDNEDIGDWDPDDDHGSYIDDDYDEF